MSDSELAPVGEGVGGGGVSTTSEREGVLFLLDAGVTARVELALGEKGAVVDGRLLVSV